MASQLFVRTKLVQIPLCQNLGLRLAVNFTISSFFSHTFLKTGYRFWKVKPAKKTEKSDIG